MSWFDTKNLKSILKEAQKQIDRALDINDPVPAVPTTASPPAAAAPVAEQPTKQEIAPSAPSPWGPFSGSFFAAADARTESSVSPADSSSSITPISELVSQSSQAAIAESESVEVLSTQNTSKLTSPTTPGSIEVLSEVASPSKATDPIAATIVTTPPSRTALQLPLQAAEEKEREQEQPDEDDGMNESNHSDKTMINSSMEILETGTQVSDSTASFEEISLRKEERALEAATTTAKEPPLVVAQSDAGDEVETGTSSDIEIISSPSTTNSAAFRESPAKAEKASGGSTNGSNGDLVIVNKKGHFREPSEVSIQSTASEDSHFSNHSETEKLLRRINELNELLEARENKLLELGRRNSELQDLNQDLTARLESKKNDPAANEEYTKRLSALEKRFQQTIRDKEDLRKELASLKEDSSGKIPKADFDKCVEEKDFMIAELRHEGEKLSKQVLNHSNIIKKLRAKERESDQQLKAHKDQIFALTEETERLKKSLAAKQEVECSQIEAVHKLSGERRRLEDENSELKSATEDLSQRLETLKASFDAAKHELVDLQQGRSEAERNAAQLERLRSERDDAAAKNAQMSEMIAELKAKTRLAETASLEREEKLRQQNLSLMRQLEEAELRLQDQTNSYSTATVPLMRQVEALRAAADKRAAVWERREKELLDQLDTAQAQLRETGSIETRFREQVAALRAQSESLETRLAATLRDLHEVSLVHETLKLQYEHAERTAERETARNKEMERRYEATVDELKRKLGELEEKVNSEEQQARAGGGVSSEEPTLIEAAKQEGGGSKPASISPTISLDHLSLADSFASNVWQGERFQDDLESNSGTANLLYGNSVLHTTSLLENLQATIKQKDGEIQQLQWEIAQFRSERNVLAEEVTKLSQEIENIRESITVNERNEKEFIDLQQQYNALLQMYGEKMEENQELRLDLEDVKDMYKTQIDALLKQNA